MRVLLVKMSSLGDIVHTLPAVTDASAQGIEFDWVVEEAFRDIPSRHPGVRAVVPIAWRRWRRSLWSSRGELVEFFRAMRARRYDMILDAQGLLKSAVVTGLARGTLKAGFTADSAREGVASLFYQRRTAIGRERHAIHRLRQLFAETFGYQLRTEFEFGLRIPTPTPVLKTSPRRCALLHGTTWSSKHWPESMWIRLARMAVGEGFDVELPWVSAQERARAERIAEASGATLWDAMSLDEVMGTLAGCTLAIGVDSGLAHLSGALKVPTVVVYGSTDSVLTGCRGPWVRNLQADFSCSPCKRRQCEYRGALPIWQDSSISPACYHSVPPEHVWRTAKSLVEEVGRADRLVSF